MIGRRCKGRKALSLPVLIGRGLEGNALGVAVWSLHRGSESQAKAPICQGSRDPNARAMAVLYGAALAPLAKFLGGDAGGVTPVPIPNTEVKPFRADGTARATARESRSPPGVIPAGGELALSPAISFWGGTVHHDDQAAA